MSYILDALKKSDQQRQRGATPTLQTAQITARAPRQPLFVFYVLLAAALLGVGITIGWLHAWQADETSPLTEPIAEPRVPISPQAGQMTLLPPSEVTRNTAQELPIPNSQPTRRAPQRDEMAKAAPAMIMVPSAAPVMPEIPAGHAGVAPEQRAVSQSELPLAIQQEIPAMVVQLHAYSNIPGERLVNINSRSLREGGYVTADLKLEQITPAGMIFTYKGHRFQRGIR